MTSERRRQRQQRIRHEAGDFQPLQKNEAPPLASKQEPIEVSKEATEYSTEANNTNQAPQSFSSKVFTPHPPHRAEDKGQRFRDDRRNVNGRGRGSFDRGRGRGRQNAAASTQRTFNSNVGTNVAVAEEREYEPVMIMESRADGPGGSGSAKLVSPFVPSHSEPTKYRRGQVESNWQPYDEIPPEDEPEEGEDYLLGEDFQQILDLNAGKSQGGFLHLKEEKSWGNVDDSQFGSFGLGALKVSDLVAALQTIPLFEQLQIPEDELPSSYISRMKQDAERARKAYQPNKEYKDETELNKQILEKLRISENEPLKLSSEGPNSTVPVSHNESSSSTATATQKFVSAFPAEPGDVDLNDLVREEALDDFPVSSGSVTPLREESGPEFDGTAPDVSKSSSGLVKCNSSGSASPSDPINQADSVKSRRPISPEGSLFSSNILNPASDQLISSAPVNSSSNHTKSKKAEFDFGLSKVSEKAVEDKPASEAAEKISTKSRKKKEIVAEESQTKKRDVQEIKKEVQQTKEPEIDLDKPTKPKCEAPPVLVSKSEVESLEDWLDSVLDD